MDTLAIRVEGLTKKFDDVVAVKDISFKIRTGTIAAILGGNGAGKTTTLSMLLGLLLPTTGKIEVLGQNMLKFRYRALSRMNFSSPYVDLPKRLTVRENLMVFSVLYRVKNPKKRIEKLAYTLGLENFLNQPVGQLSSGQRTRVALAKALVNKPSLLLLDEPTGSLDPDTADWVRVFLENYAKTTKATILLTSHNMGEVERLCSKVLMMKNGGIVDEGNPNYLIKKYGRNTLEQVFLDIARSEKKKLQEDAEYE